MVLYKQIPQEIFTAAGDYAASITSFPGLLDLNTIQFPTFTTDPAILSCCSVLPLGFCLPTLFKAILQQKCFPYPFLPNLKKASHAPFTHSSQRPQAQGPWLFQET